MALARRGSGGALGAWDPFRELEEMSARIGQLFRPGDESSKGLALAGFDWSPSVNISETEGAYVIRADLPGITKEEVEITLEDGVLTLKGERQQRSEQKEEKHHRVESSYGAFLRRFTLPEDATVDDVKAEMRDGCLEVTVPRSGDRRPRVRQIEVH